MQVPLQIVLGQDIPDTAREQIEKAAEALQELHNRIVSCRVAVTMPDRRHRSGGLFDVHITLRIPKQADIVVSRRLEDAPEREHLEVALRRAFHEARRQLQEAAREMRADVKSHVPPDHGVIAKLLPEEGYGLIEASDGHEIYFHRNSVTDGHFPSLKVGVEVRFVEALGDKGPQASAVTVIGKHHLS